METLLIDQQVAESFLPKLAVELSAKGVTVKGDQTVHINTDSSYRIQIPRSPIG
jgi:gamma-glutamyl phosphate reductase